MSSANIASSTTTTTLDKLLYNNKKLNRLLNMDVSVNGDQRARDAADTLVSLAHSTASNSAQSTPTPTNENKKIIEFICESNDTNSINDDSKLDKNEYRIPTQACKVIQEILKTYTNSNLKSITITTQHNNSPSTTILDTTKRANSMSSLKSSTSSTLDDDEDDDTQSSFSSMSQHNNNNNKLNVISSNYVSSSSSCSGGNRRTHKRLTSADNRVQYGPILVRPRSKAAPTLATGRRSKDESLPPDEARKRQERRERNKEAAAKCRRKREEVADILQKKSEDLNREQEELMKKYEILKEEKIRLETILRTHEKQCKKIKTNHSITNTQAILIPIKTEDTDVKMDIDTDLLPPQTPIIELQTPIQADKTFDIIQAKLPTQQTSPKILINDNNDVDDDVDQFDNSNSSKSSNSKNYEKPSPMISGCNTNKNFQNDIQHEFHLERPKNLPLSLVFRQDSLTVTPNETLNTPNIQLSLNLQHHHHLHQNQSSPTITLNTPILTIQPIESLQNAYSPTNNATTQKHYQFILKSLS